MNKLKWIKWQFFGNLVIQPISFVCSSLSSFQHNHIIIILSLTIPCKILFSIEVTTTPSEATTTPSIVCPSSDDIYYPDEEGFSITISGQDASDALLNSGQSVDITPLEELEIKAIPAGTYRIVNKFNSRYCINIPNLYFTNKANK